MLSLFYRRLPAIILPFKHVRYFSYNDLRNAEEIEEIRLRINARQFYVTLKSCQDSRFVKISEVSKFKRTAIFLDMDQEVLDFMINLDTVKQLPIGNFVEQDVKCHDEIKQLVISKLSSGIIGTLQRRSDGGKDKNGIRIEAASVEKLTTALHSLLERKVL